MKTITKGDSLRGQIRNMAPGDTLAINAGAVSPSYPRYLTSLLSFELRRQYKCSIDRKNSRYVIYRIA